MGPGQVPLLPLLRAGPAYEKLTVDDTTIRHNKSTTKHVATNLQQNTSQQVDDKNTKK